jgi:methyl coenzyme M reductase gamma subunit
MCVLGWFGACRLCGCGLVVPAKAGIWGVGVGGPCLRKDDWGLVWEALAYARGTGGLVFTAKAVIPHHLPHLTPTLTLIYHL